jgi:membrane protein implicated in regulation of membrane protease activity
MDSYWSFSYWVFRPEVWVIVGIILICLDIFLGFDFFVLPIGIASIIMSGIIYSQENLWFGDWTAFESWKGALIWFAVLSLVSIFVIRIFFQNNNSDKPDINEY